MKTRYFWITRLVLRPNIQSDWSITAAGKAHPHIRQYHNDSSSKPVGNGIASNFWTFVLRERDGKRKLMLTDPLQSDHRCPNSELGVDVAGVLCNVDITVTGRSHCEATVRWRHMQHVQRSCWVTDVDIRQRLSKIGECLDINRCCTLTKRALRIQSSWCAQRVTVCNKKTKAITQKLKLLVFVTSNDVENFVVTEQDTSAHGKNTSFAQSDLDRGECCSCDLV